MVSIAVDKPLKVCEKCGIGFVYYDSTKNDLCCSYCRQREPVNDLVILRRRGNPGVVSMETKQNLLLFKGHLSIRKIAKITGYSHTTIENIFKEHKK